MKATVDTFVPTHIKGPFEGRALCDHAVMMVSRGRSGVNTAGQAHIDCNLSPPPSLPPSLNHYEIQSKDVSSITHFDNEFEEHLVEKVTHLNMCR